MQMALFGYAINTDPKHLDTAIINADNTDITRSFVSAMKNSTYFKFVGELPNEAAGREALARGRVLFVVNIPAGFTRQLLRHERPSLLIEADATDPSAAANAIFALERHCAVGGPERTHRAAGFAGRQLPHPSMLKCIASTIPTASRNTT